MSNSKEVNEKPRITWLAEEKRPKTWDDFVGNPHIKSTLQYYITNYKTQSLSCIFITGNPGTGKNSLANLWITSLLCLNRSRDSPDPCGHCDVCKGKDTRGIYEYAVSDATEAKEKLSYLSQISVTLPPPNKNNEVIRNLIVVNELQNASATSHKLLLDIIENSPATTTWILVTMDLDSFQPTVRNALLSRSLHIHLPNPSLLQIKNKLLKEYPNFNKNAAEALCYFSRGNLRRLWSLLQLFHPVKDIEDITDTLIYDTLAGGCTKASRVQLWEALYEGRLEEIDEILNRWFSSANEDIIINLLLEDLYYSNNNQVVPLISSLSKWTMSRNKVSIKFQLIPYVGVYNPYIEDKVNLEIKSKAKSITGKGTKVEYEDKQEYKQKEEPISLMKNSKLFDLTSAVNKATNRNMCVYDLKKRSPKYSISKETIALFTLKNLNDLYSFYCE